MLVNETDKAYKRGVVLGLTLAELLILFVFCLLLLFALWATRTLQANSAARTQSDRAWQAIQREMDKLRGERPLEDFWRELKAAYGQPRTSKTTPSAPSTDEERQRVITEIEELRGTRAIEEYWRELKWTKQEAALQKGVNTSLTEQMEAQKQKIAQLEQELQKARSDLAKAEHLRSKAEEEAKKAREEAERAKRAEAKARAEGQAAKKAAGEHNWPPIIKLKDEGVFRFAAGDARLTPAFEEKLRTEVVQEILQYIDKFKVDVIEVVGHTDDVHVGRFSNLDGMLLPFLHSEKGHVPLSAADNAGLGLARAVSVVRFLMNDERLKGRGHKILPLSSAQTLDKDGALARSGPPRDDRERRRIEIRLRRSVEEAAKQ